MSLSASVIEQNSRSRLGQLFFHRVSELGERTFSKIQRCGSFEDISWRDVGAMVQNTLLGLHALGMTRGDNVAILGDNSLPWLCADLATLAGGLANVVISPNASDATLLKILAQSLSTPLPPGDCSRLKRDCLICRTLLFWMVAPKSFAAASHLPSCWNRADDFTSANWIHCWKQSTQVILRPSCTPPGPPVSPKE